MWRDRKSRRWLLIVLAGIAIWCMALPGDRAVAGPFEDGVAFFQGGHYRWALEKFIEAVDSVPKDPHRRWYLAETYRLLGDVPAAAQIFRQVIQMAPQSALASAARGGLESMGEPTWAAVQVSFQKRGGSILVPGKVNEQVVGYFVLDTGATYTTINRVTADALGIPGGSTSVRLSTASGLIQAPLALLDQVDVGGAVARHVPVVIHDLPNAPESIIGLLGLSFLERFQVQLDPASGTVIFGSGR